MPELPEVEAVAVALRANLTGRRLDGIRVPFAGVLDQSVRRTRSALVGRILSGVHRHGKYLILAFDTEESVDVEAGEIASNCLMIHLRMTGQIFIQDDYTPDKHVHVILDFAGLPVHYRDIRKFGRLTLVDDPITPSALSHVGPDMLEVRFTSWLDRVADRRAPIKAMLLDQGIAAGLGNIYVDESLFVAGVHPLSRPVDLTRDELHEIWRRAKQVLRLAIRHGGTTFLNFANFHGKPGNFRRKLRVYGRAGQPCRDCRNELVKIQVAGRSSVFCPLCQPAR